MTLGEKEAAVKALGAHGGDGPSAHVQPDMYCEFSRVQTLLTLAIVEAKIGSRI
jgi:hypothetical protein